ncbi:MAG: exo-alpha-sialidase [Caldilineaceae bacterium]|nr:exo-alpha-sialidase [Caldilineaceae bacterium]
MTSDDSFHPRDKSRPFVAMQARSLDGGRTWQVDETPCRTPGGRSLSADEHVLPEHQLSTALDQEDGIRPPPDGIDFAHPDFALMCARTGLTAGARSWFYASTDRCRSWQGPYALPSFDQSGIAARTDYVVEGPSSCLLFLTAAKPNGDEGRVFCARTEDGGKSFGFVDWVTPEPAGYAIMPASVRLPGGRLLCAVRYRGSRSDGPNAACWIDLFTADDGGAKWRLLARPVADTGFGGNPPTLTRLADGRLCITYGFRAEPFGIRAVISEDDGQSWGAPIVLRADGGNHDLGYPRTVQRPDGKLVTVYYFNDRPDGERYIGATLWDV